MAARAGRRGNGKQLPHRYVVSFWGNKNVLELYSGIGYKEFYDYLYGDVSLYDVVNKIKVDSRRYSKRQYTFFKHQFESIEVSSSEEIMRIIKDER